MKKLFFVFITAFLLIGCVSYKDEIDFNRDFSGKTKIELTVSKILSKELDKDFNLSKLGRFLGKEKNGITLEDFDRIEKGNLVTYLFRIKFRSIKALNNFSLDDFQIENQNSKNHLFDIHINRENGRIFWRRILKIENKQKTGETPKEILAVLFANYIWEYRVRFPYEVLKTNGILEDDKKTVYWKYDLYTILLGDTITLEAVLKEPSLWERFLNLFK